LDGGVVVLLWVLRNRLIDGFSSSRSNYNRNTAVRVRVDVISEYLDARQSNQS
jgi:hypothetical protein